LASRPNGDWGRGRQISGRGRRTEVRGDAFRVAAGGCLAGGAAVGTRRAPRPPPERSLDVEHVRTPSEQFSDEGARAPEVRSARVAHQEHTPLSRLPFGVMLGRIVPPPSLKLDRARYVLTLDAERRIIRDGSNVIEAGRITHVGKADDLADTPADRVIDARDLV